MFAQSWFTFLGRNKETVIAQNGVICTETAGVGHQIGEVMIGRILSMSSVIGAVCSMVWSLSDHRSPLKLSKVV